MGRLEEVKNDLAAGAGAIENNRLKEVEKKGRNNDAG